MGGCCASTATSVESSPRASAVARNAFCHAHASSYGVNVDETSYTTHARRARTADAVAGRAASHRRRRGVAPRRGRPSLRERRARADATNGVDEHDAPDDDARREVTVVDVVGDAVVIVDVRSSRATKCGRRRSGRRHGAGEQARATRETARGGRGGRES